MNINHAILHVLDFVSCVNVYAQQELDLSSKNAKRYVTGHARRLLNNIDAKRGEFAEDSMFAEELRAVPPRERLHRPLGANRRVHRRRARAHGESRIDRRARHRLRRRPRHRRRPERRRRRRHVRRSRTALFRHRAPREPTGVHARGGNERYGLHEHRSRAASRHLAESLAEGRLVRPHRSRLHGGVVLR